MSDLDFVVFGCYHGPTFDESKVEVAAAAMIHTANHQADAAKSKINATNMPIPFSDFVEQQWIMILTMDSNKIPIPRPFSLITKYGAPVHPTKNAKRKTFTLGYNSLQH